MTRKILTVTVSSIFSMILNLNQAFADEATLLQPSDLKYLGAFRVTYAKHEQGRIGFSPARIAVSSETNTFFINGNPFYSIAEYKIPEIINSENIEDLAYTGKPIQEFTDIFAKVQYKTEHNNIRSIGGMELIDGKLVASVFDPYDAASKYGFDVDNMMIINEPFDLKNSTVTGFFQMQDKTFAAGWFSPIPSNLQDALGGDYLSGMARQGSINGRWSQGPSAYSLFKDNLLNTQNGETTPNIKLQKYPLFNQMTSLSTWNYNRKDKQNCPSFSKDSSLWNEECLVGNDLWTELSKVYYGVIVPGTHTYLTIGHSGGHRKGIGYKNTPIGRGGACSGECPHIWSDWDNYIWLFDIKDMIKYKNGETQEYDAKPYAYGPIKLPFDDINEDGIISKIAGADYDPINNRLYIVLYKADDKRRGEATPMILVYEINIKRPKAPTITWKAPTAYEDGTPLAKNDILEYRVHYGTDKNNLNKSFLIKDGKATSYVMDYKTHSLERDTTYYLAMNAVTRSGAQSKLSNIKSFNSK